MGCNDNIEGEKYFSKQKVFSHLKAANPNIQAVYEGYIAEFGGWENGIYTSL